MKIANIKLLGLSAAIALSLCSFGAYAEDSKIEPPSPCVRIVVASNF